MAQTSSPTKIDYCELVTYDFKIINQEIDLNKINTISDLQFRNIIQKHIKEAALPYLSEIQAGHTKVIDIKYTKLVAHEYI